MLLLNATVFLFFVLALWLYLVTEHKRHLKMWGNLLSSHTHTHTSHEGSMFENLISKSRAAYILSVASLSLTGIG